MFHVRLGSHNFLCLFIPPAPWRAEKGSPVFYQAARVAVYWEGVVEQKGKARHHTPSPEPSDPSPLSLTHVAALGTGESL